MLFPSVNMERTIFKISKNLAKYKSENNFIELLIIYDQDCQ